MNRAFVPSALRAASRIAALLLAAALAACGPGTGGTGTGGALLDPFDAQPAALCASVFAPALSCTAPGNADNPGAGVDVNGTARVLYVDRGAGATVIAELSNNQLELDARCDGAQFSGLWGTSATFGTAFYGRYRSRGGELPAVLVVQPVSGAIDELGITIRDAAGAPLLGPLVLRRTTQPPLAGGC